jgi:predicted protein tyrosine phosphatase
VKLAEEMRVLFVCSQNRLRSPTAEVVFSTIEGVEALSAGTDSDAVTPVSADLIEWAELILVMERVHYRRLQERLGKQLKGKRVSVLRIRDDYDYMDPDLIRILREKVTPLLKLQAPSLK